MNASTLKIMIMICLIGAASVFAQQNNLIYDKLVKPENVEYYNVPVGLCEDYPEETTTMEVIRNDFEFLKKNGVNLLRISFGWDAIEAEKDKYDWLFWDDYVKMAVDEYGITLVPYICYTPQWASRGKEDTLFFWNYPPEDFSEFGEFMKDLVNRYKDRIHSWELWNEPDIDIYWQGTNEEFAEFTKVGAQAVREADPEALIVLGGIAYKPDWVRQLFRDHGVSPYVDVVNMHNYYETWHRSPVEHIDDYINEVADVVQLYGDGQSLWMAEVGYSTFRQGKNVSEVYDAYYDYEHTPAYQAQDLVKRLGLAFSTEKLAAITWYELKDLTPSDEVIGDLYNNKHLGVANFDWSPKPATDALVFMNKLFSDGFRSIDGLVKVSKPINSDAYVHAFEKENGDVVLMGWLQTYVRGERRDTSGSHKDERMEMVDVSIPLELNGTALLYDETGKSSPFEKINRENNAVRIEDFTLRGNEVKIIRINKQEN